MLLVGWSCRLVLPPELEKKPAKTERARVSLIVDPESCCGGLTIERMGPGSEPILDLRQLTRSKQLIQSKWISVPNGTRREDLLGHPPFE